MSGRIVFEIASRIDVIPSELKGSRGITSKLSPQDRSANARMDEHRGRA